MIAIPVPVFDLVGERILKDARFPIRVPPKFLMPKEAPAYAVFFTERAVLANLREFQRTKNEAGEFEYHEVYHV